MDAPTLRLLAGPYLSGKQSHERLDPGQVTQFLAVLAYHSDWMHRDELIGLFWPDGSDASGRRNLRRLLFRARERLRCAGDGSLPDIEAAGDALRWKVRTDVHAWREALAAERFEAAATWWRGPLCEGINPRGDAGFGTWLAAERELMAEAWKDAVLPYASRIAPERPDEASDLLARLVAIDPLDENVVRAHLRALFRAGRWVEGDRAYHAFAARLSAELDLEPEPATTAILAEASRASSSRNDGAAGRGGDPSLGHRVRAHSLAFPLTGRETELGELGARLELARRGAGGAVVIEGEAGVGKTRLADAFLARASAENVEVFRGRPFERELGAPLEPVLTALASLTSTAASETVARTSAWLPDRPALVDAHQRITGQLVQAARSAGGAVLFIDDLQWADAATLDFLAYAAKRAGSEPLLIVIGLRREDRPTLAPWLSDLARHRALHAVQLRRLARQDLVDLLAGCSALGDHDLDWLGGHLHAQTEGNPFYASEYLRWLVVEGWVELGPAGRLIGIDRERIASAELPETVQSLIRATYQRFAGPTRAILDRAAVLGRSFELSLLEAATCSTEREFGSAFAPLVESGVILDADGGQLAFSHDKFRQAIYEGLAAPVRHALHAQAAAVLSRYGAEPSELAHHHLRARQWEEAYTQLLAAGDQADRRAAWQVAIAAFARAEAVAVRLAEPARCELEALKRRERILEVLDHRSARSEAVERMIALSRALADASAEAHALLRKMGLRALAGDREGVRAMRRRAMRLFEQLGDPSGEARAYRELAVAAFSLGDHRAVVDAGMAALRTYRAAGDAPNEAATAWTVAMAHRHMDLVEEALEWCHRAADVYDTFDEVTGDFVRHEMEAWAKRRAGALEEACASLATTLSLAEELGEPLVIMDQHMKLGSALLELGHARDALAQFEQGTQIGAQLGDPRYEGNHKLQIGAVRQRLGDLDGAIDAYRHAARLLGSAHAVTGIAEDRLGRADALTLLARALGEAGRNGPEAVASLDEALEVAREQGDRLRASRILMERGVWHWRARRCDDAAEDFGGAAAAAAEIGVVSRETAAQASRLVALVDGARHQEAIAAGERALALLCAFPDPAAEAHVCQALARAWTGHGDSRRARALRMRARRLRQGGSAPGASRSPYRDAEGGA